MEVINQMRALLAYYDKRIEESLSTTERSIIHGEVLMYYYGAQKALQTVIGMMEAEKAEV